MNTTCSPVPSVGFRRSALVAAFAAILAAGVAYAQPKPPSAFCAATSGNCEPGRREPAASSTAARPVKWHPGHYMNLPRSRELTSQSARFEIYDEIGANRDIAGVSVFFRWPQLEGKRGDYSAGIALIRAEVDKLKSLPAPKRLIINMMDRAYGNPNCAAAKEYYPAYILAEAGTHLYSTRTACGWKRWNPSTMTRYIELMSTLGKAFDREPYVEMISPFHETALNWSGGPEASGFSEDGYERELRRLAKAMRESWPTTIVRIPANWGLEEPRLASFIEYLAANGLGAGNPDICPTCNMAADRIIRGAAGRKDYRGLIANVMGVESSTLGYDAVGPKGGFSVQEVFAFAHDLQRATHILWDRNVHVGNESPDPAVGQRWPAMLRLFSTHPVTNTACPKAFAGGCSSN